MSKAKAAEPPPFFETIGKPTDLVVLMTGVFCSFELPGEPRAWARPGAAVRRGKIHWYVRPEEIEYRRAVAWGAKAAMRGKKPSKRPVAVMVHALMPVPESWSKRKKQDALAGWLKPTSKPDADNVAKLVGDALRGIAYVDDAQVTDLRVAKRFARDGARLRVDVRET